MHPPLTALYAALLAIVFLILSLRVIRQRRQTQTALGTGNHPALERAARVHANFAEYTPLALLLIFLVESSGYSKPIIHALGAALLLGRCAHAFGVSQPNENFRFRVVGMMATFITLAISAAFLLAAFV